MADEQDNTVIEFPKRPLSNERRVELWEGIVRVMEASGLKKIEINLTHVKEVAAMARELAR